MLSGQQSSWQTFLMSVQELLHMLARLLTELTCLTIKVKTSLTGSSIFKAYDSDLSKCSVSIHFPPFSTDVATPKYIALAICSPISLMESSNSDCLVDPVHWEDDSVNPKYFVQLTSSALFILVANSEEEDDPLPHIGSSLYLSLHHQSHHHYHHHHLLQYHQYKHHQHQ